MVSLSSFKLFKIQNIQNVICIFVPMTLKLWLNAKFTNDIKTVMWIPSCTFVWRWFQPYFQVLDNRLNTNVRWNNVKWRWERSREHEIDVSLKSGYLISLILESIVSELKSKYRLSFQLQFARMSIPRSRSLWLPSTCWTCMQLACSVSRSHRWRWILKKRNHSGVIQSIRREKIYR